LDVLSETVNKAYAELRLLVWERSAKTIKKENSILFVQSAFLG
jgi:hypothetical protein